MGQKKFFESKKFLVQKIIYGTNFWVKKFLSKKNFGLKNDLLKKTFGQKNFLVKKISWSKNFWGKKNIVSKNFGLIDLNPKFVLSKEKTGRVNPRWRMYDPPPENSRVKIVLDCC